MIGDTLQGRAKAWHTERFPYADVADVVLKAAEEVGEVAQVVSSVVGRNDAHKPPKDPGERVTDEAADVVIALLVLVGRYTDEENLLEAVDRKLAILETAGAHPASARKP